MNKIRNIQKLNKRELEEGIAPSASWHTDYRDTAFIYIGGLPFELSEGDIIAVFSQYGEPVWIKLARDKETGKSRGFAWLKYEDQRSCDLAVDNLAGANILDRIVSVDHARYKPRDDEDMRDNTMGEIDLDLADYSDEGGRKRRRTESDSESDEDRPMLPEEIDLEKLIDSLDEDDPMKESMVKRQQEKADAALAKLKKAKRRERKERDRERRHRRDRSKDRHREHDRSPRRIKDTEDDSSHHRSRRRRGSSANAPPRDASRDREDRHRHRSHRHKDEDREERSHHRERRRHSVDEQDTKGGRRRSSSASPRRNRS